MLARSIVSRRTRVPRPAPDDGLFAARGLDRYGPEIAADALVAEAMATRVTACGPDADLADIAEIMLAHDVREVLVVDNGDVLGTITDRDLLRTMLRREDDQPSEPPPVALDDAWLHQPLELQAVYS
jgi:CBS domain-containing protein